jgi:ribosomal protein S16
MGRAMIRLQRLHKTRNNPVYNICVTDYRKGRNSGSYVEKVSNFVCFTKNQIGVYSPIETPTEHQVLNREIEGQREMLIDFERAKYWLSRGAQPTAPVHRLLTYSGILPPTPKLVPKGWDVNKFENSFAEANRYFKQKFKIENAAEF